MEFAAADGERKYAELVAAAAEAVIACDFDGTLSPIVDNPVDAYVHPSAHEVLIALAPSVKALAIVTGRPAAQVVSLGRLDDLADALAQVGRELYVFGQYGNERWSSRDRTVAGPPPPAGLGAFTDALPSVLYALDAGEAYIEKKGLAVAVHTRRLASPDEVQARLLPEVSLLAAEHGLVVEPGKQVIEVRAGGMDKGQAMETLVAEAAAGAVLFAGDDLGDVDAFESVAAMGKTGLPTFLVYSLTGAPNVLAETADVVVDGPAGVLDLLRELTADIAAAG